MMNGAIFVLAVNLTITLVMSAAFFAIAWFDRANRPARWLGLAFVCAALSYGGEYVLATGHFEQTAYMVAALAMLLTFLLAAHTAALLYRVRLHWAVLVAVFGVSGLLYWVILDLPRNDMLRQAIYQLPYAVASLVIVWVIARARRRSLIEWGLIAAFVFLAAHFMSKPFLAQMTGGVGDEARDYASTLYGAISQSSGGVLLLVLAMGALGITARNSAAALISRSERDRETSLYNQNGFETHAARHLRASNTSGACRYALTLFTITGAPVSRDLTAIARAAGLVLLDHSGPGTLAGRMAPLDFALLEKDIDLRTAQRRAETIRSALAETLVSDTGRRIDISAGVTEREQADSWADMLARGLWALEEARKAGGNCVRLAARSGVALSRL